MVGGGSSEDGRQTGSRARFDATSHVVARHDGAKDQLFFLVQRCADDLAEQPAAQIRPALDGTSRRALALAGGLGLLPLPLPAPGAAPTFVSGFVELLTLMLSDGSLCGRQVRPAKVFINLALPSTGPSWKMP